MTILGIIQIIYLSLNVLALVIGLAAFGILDELPFITKLFEFIGKHIGNIGLTITSIFFALLFLPAIATIAVFITIFILVNLTLD